MTKNTTNSIKKYIDWCKQQGKRLQDFKSLQEYNEQKEAKTCISY